MLSLPAVAQGDLRSDTGGARVIGGVYANPDAWSFPAYVLIDRNLQCGGTLVAPNFVLTAGHCAVDSNSKIAHPASSYEIRLGSIYPDRGGEVHGVKRVIPHQKFSEKFPLENDIALLELDTPSKLTPAVLDGLPAAGSESRLAVEAKVDPWAKILGWGRTNPDPTVNSLSDRLREAHLPIVDNDVCQRQISGELRNFGPIDGRRLCAGQSSGGVDSCNGDSGGPILSQAANREWVQIGIVSYGVERCGVAGAYGVYTRVSAFADWLKSNLRVADSHAPPPDMPVSPITSAATLIEAAEKGDGQVKVDILDAGAFSGGRCDKASAPAAAGLLPVNECLVVKVTSVVAGYLLLLDVGEDGKITQLFPNRYSEKSYANGHIAAGSLTLPDSTYGFALPTSLDAGHQQERNRVIAVVAQDKSVFGALGEANKGFGDVGSDGLARLEVVLKPKPGPGGNVGRWAAGLHDYVVNR
jgi:hypothetical protein